MEKIAVENRIIDLFPLPCLRVDEHGVITDINEAAEKLTGYSKEAAIGRDHFAILHGTETKEICPYSHRQFKAAWHWRLRAC